MKTVKYNFFINGFLGNDGYARRVVITHLRGPNARGKEVVEIREGIAEQSVQSFDLTDGDKLVVDKFWSDVDSDRESFVPSISDGTREFFISFPHSKVSITKLSR